MDRADHTQAQVDMIDEALKWARVPLDGSTVSNMVDVGCGIGGSSRHIANALDCDAEGITLSPVQARRANEALARRGVSRAPLRSLRNLATLSVLD